MTSPHQSDEKCTNSNKNGQSFRRVAERVQQWNRAIPEAGYITLGTIRYGVRLSSGQHPLATHQGLPSILPPAVHSNDTDHVTDPSLESTHSATPDTCCCVGQTSGIGLPWTSNFNSRTKLPVPTSVGAKNRTLSTTQSPSSFSLAVSSAPPPTHTTASSRSQSFLSSVSLRDDRTAAVTDRDAETLIQTDLSNKMIAPVGTTSTQATIPKMIASCVATTPPTTTITPTTLYAGSDSNSRLVHRKRSCGCCQSSGGGNNPISSNTSTRSSTSNSIGCCCELNSGSVSVGQFRELSPPATSKSTLSTSPSSTSICCYTIANSSKSISKHANNHRTHHSHQKRIPRAILQQNLPDNKIVAGPPIPPPRPRPKNPSSSANNNNIHSSNRNSNDSQSIDPINFRRKLQHFESRKSDSHHENNAIGCGGGDHTGGGFELLNCFSSSSVNSDSSTRKNNCCSPNNSEISYSGSSSSKSDPQVITSKLQRTNNHDHLSYLNDSNQKRSPITRNNNSHQNLTNSKNSNNNCVVVRKLTPKLTKKTVPILQQYGVNNGHHNTGNDLHVLSQHVARSDSEDRLLRDSTVAPSSASSTCGGGPITDNDNDRDRVTATLVEIVNDDDDDDDDGDDDDDYEYDDDQDDDDSEICFIDSSADGDHLSSQSDIDLIGSLNNHNINNYLTTTQNNTHQNRRAILSEPILTVAGARSLLPAATAKLPPSHNNLSYDHQVPNNSLINFNNSLRNNRDTDTGKLISASSLSENFHLSNFLNNSKSNNNLRVVSVFNNNSKANSNSSSGEFFDTSSGTTVLYRNDRIAPRIDRSRSFDFYKKSPAGGITVTGPALSTPSPPPLPPYPPPLIYTSQQLPLGGQNKGPYIIGRRVSSSDSFGNFTRNQLHASLSPETGLIMERRRNTLDRLQRLRFGRKSSPTPSQQDKSSSSSSRKANEKSEVLKELTERLKGNRSSPTPPPIPPPRKPRQCNSLEKPISDSSPLASSIFGSDDIIPMDEDEEHIPEPVNRKSDDISHRLDEQRETQTKPPPPPPPLPAPSIALIPSTPLPQKASLYQTLRPNTSVSNLESLILRRGYPDDAKSAPTDTVKEEDLFTKLPRAESRTIVGAYTQKSIPFRSASFSQIDYSSGKYIKSALSAIRDKLRRDKEPSVVENANLTLPRKKDENRNHSPNRYLTHTDEENGRSSGKSDVTFSLSFEPENDRMSLEEIVNPPDVILEEESSIAETEKSEVSEDHKDPAGCPAEDQMDTTEIREEQLPETIAANYVDASETTLATLTEEEIPLESPPENLMQTATTCLIPVPVYECGAREWGTERVEEQWVNVEQNEIGMTPEGIDQLPDHLGPFRADGKINMNSIPDVVSSEVSHINCDQVPTISVSPDIAHQSDSTSDKSSPDDKHVEFPEVRKRYSNDDLKVGDKTQVSDAPVPRGNSIEEKRRIDKSRRRKGMYIQWPTINKHGVIENPEWEDEAQHDNNQNHQANNAPTKGIHLDFSKIKVNIGHETETATFDIPTPASLYSSYDPSTPESECNRPVWPKGSADSRRTSLTCQSSEEKDDMPPQHSSGHKSHRNLMFLRSDSISDNESDQRSRDRTSPSPAPGDQDLKRYSKRPLRGPYGQMLEAEMKKPGKMHYDEILEDLKNSDSLNTLSPPIRNRAIVGNHSFDESAARQQKNSRSRKSSAHLPIPVHTRAASTPSQMENTSTTPSLDTITPEHKRYQSNIDNTYLDASSAARLKDSTKKLSPDNRDRSPKRASSEALETKQQHAKRSASTASEKQQKRSLDEMRLSSRTTSERSMADSGKSSSNLLATPELLAELLKGSSERLVAEQRQQMFAISHKWFTLASPLYAKRRSKMSNATTPPSPKSSSPSNNNNNNNNNNRQKLRLSLFDLHQSNLNSSCDNPSSQDEMPNNGSSSIDTIVTLRSDRFQKMPSSTCSDSEDDNDRKAQVDLNNKLNLQEEGDTRTHIVQEIFQNEQSYVEDLQTVIVKYLNVLKTPEYAGMIDSKTVDEIFFMVPEILNIHERFLNELRRRLDVWEPQQQVGDAFIEAFSRPEVLDTYTSFVNNCNRAKDAIRMTCQARPSFSRFLQATSREHKGKLTLDNLLIKPVQKFPNYELLFRRLIKHTDVDHLDQRPLQDALKLAHDILLHINCKKKEGLENGQREATLRELEGVIEGVSDLVATERQFLALDVVSMPNGQGARKERGFFLFSDLLVITSIKRRSGTIRKPNTTVCPGSVTSTLDTNKYKFLMKIPLDNMEIVKSKDESLRKIMNEIDQLVDDYSKIQQITKIVSSLRCPHQHLEETIKDLHRDIDSQLKELKSQDNQLNMLELTVNLPNGIQNMSIAFSKPETRSQWEENFGEAKQKLAASLDRHPIPEFLTSIPIRKTRAGLQFTCASPTLSNQKDVWVCNSDGYVGQVCVLSLSPEPTVTSCNGVCNARILCVASVPACSDLTDQASVSSSNCDTPRSSRNSNSSTCHSLDKQLTKSKPETGSSNIKLDSSSSSSDSEIEQVGNQERLPSPTPAVASHQHQDSSDDGDGLQSTMWLGTEDGCIHVYNCTDNIRIKKNKIKIPHVSAVYSILYLDNRVFVSLANGDICVYLRDSAGWNTLSPHCIPIGTVTSPVNRLLNVHGKLWCSIQGIIKVLDTKTLQVENQIQISSDSKPITNMAVSNNYVWISIQNSAHIKCFHSNSYEQIFEVNLAPSVNKMLCNCDDIIRQHKAACLRVTSLLACKDMIWIGTSAGVLLTIPSLGHNKGSTSNTPVVTGIPHGHTGHVRFLTFVETEPGSSGSGDENGSIGYGVTEPKVNRLSLHTKSKSETGTVLIISGGDGYEDFRSSGANTMSEVAGREDSTNHLLLWQM